MHGKRIPTPVLRDGSTVPKPKDVAPPTKIPQQRIQEGMRWSFSFRFWRQMENFGLDLPGQPRWFVSLLERLRGMGAELIDDLLQNARGLADGLRFRALDHSNEHVTMERSDFDWIDRAYRADEENYPLHYFHVSQAHGRVIGFFDEHWTFQVVLLDPMHNLYLTNYSGYKIRKTRTLDSEHTDLLAAMGSALACLDGKPDEAERCRRTLVEYSTHGIAPLGKDRIVVTIQTSDAVALKNILSEHPGESVSSVFEAGLLAYLDKANAILEETIDAAEATSDD